MSLRKRALRSCIFCDIVAGRKPACVVLEQEHSTTFLDRRPLFPGHCLVVPRDHCVTLADLMPSRVEPFFKTVQWLCVAVEAAMGADGTFVAVNNRVSQSVPHLHAHVVPRRKGDGLRGFFWPRNPYRDEAHMADVQQRIQAALRELLPPEAPSTSF